MNNEKYALITGATSGIGYELAKLFAKDHYNLIIVARDENELSTTASKLKQEFNISVETISKDLFKKESPFEVYDEVKLKGIEIDVLVNDAGHGYYGQFLDTDIGTELDIIQLNIGAYVVLTKCFLKDMVARGEGKILNVGSIAGEAPGPWQSVYHGTKAFVNSWSAAIQHEVKDKGVSVTCLLPGATDTDFFRKAEMEESKIVQENDLDDPAGVARDGYEGLMAGKPKVISGLKNKMQVGMGNILPDSVAAAQMSKQQEPVRK
ncbi:SDR family NAD(P)-dependent oxidoreductase [Desertivirga xinjiangensis]|uniref:SDR family NAD(P)-dependent oxidoreductase n=1 Tax=Desertivirga xinjiangensis TaxID=539206 RepID=UPI00210CF84B|nr:SDR family oxidoreductase [Pedobacter xinjiangensis]